MHVMKWNKIIHLEWLFSKFPHLVLYRALRELLCIHFFHTFNLEWQEEKVNLPNLCMTVAWKGLQKNLEDKVTI